MTFLGFPLHGFRSICYSIYDDSKGATPLGCEIILYSRNLFGVKQVINCNQFESLGDSYFVHKGSLLHISEINLRFVYETPLMSNRLKRRKEQRNHVFRLRICITAGRLLPSKHRIEAQPTEGSFPNRLFHVFAYFIERFRGAIFH